MQQLIIRSALDIQKLPGYKPRVRPAEDSFKKILQPYFLRAPLQCALCGQWHKEGYIVELVLGGLTNIGHICGRSTWVTFERLENEYLETQLRPKLIAKLHKSDSRIAELAGSTYKLRADAIQLGQRKKEFLRRFPNLCVDLKRRAHENKSVIGQSRERDTATVDALLALNPAQSRASLRYEEVPIGAIRGLNLFKANIHEAVVVQFVAKVEALQSINLASMPIQDLNEWDVWLDSVDELQEQALNALADGVAFFDRTNLTLLQHIATAKSELLQLERLNPDDLDLPIERFTLHPELAKKLNRAERRRLQFKAKQPTQA